MQPIPETLEAINELDPYVDDGSLLDQLTEMAARARSVAPNCVGVSVASLDQGVTFTLVATDDEVAALDGIQYLESGPCVAAVEEKQGMITNLDDLLSEPRWQALGQASAASGVRSTLTFPVIRDGEVVGSVNMYGASDDTFVGKHQELAAVFGGWAPGAVANADLSFSTRSVAEAAPEQIRAETRVEVATGILAAASGLDVEEAKDRLRDAAQRAGVTVGRLAEAIISLRQG